MMQRKVALLAIVIAALCLPSSSQRRGGSAQGSRNVGQSQSQTQQRNQGGAAQGTMTRDMQRDRLHTQATTQQRDQYRACDQSLDRVRTHAGNMAKVQTRNFDAGAARRQHNQLREQIQNMQQNHERMMTGLGNEQQGAVQERTRNMQQIQERVNNQLQEMDQELAKPSPNGKAVAQQARSIEREMKDWQNEHRRMGDALGLND
jgi:hypothetical protein